MPRFHFHVHAAIVAPDDEGLELPDLDAAKTEAVTAARFLVVEELRRDSRFSPNHLIRITDPEGLLLHTTRYGDCVDVRL